MTLHNMRQNRDESIRNFGACLRGQAGICKFVIDCNNCNAKVNYTEAIMRDVLTMFSLLFILYPKIIIFSLKDNKSSSSSMSEEHGGEGRWTRE